MDADAYRPRLDAAVAPAAQARAAVAGELRALTAALEDEADLGRRIALEEERMDLLARRVTPAAAEALERVRAEARALGWPSARALLGAVQGVDLAALAAEAEALLRATAAPELGDGPLAHHDLPRLRRAAWADALLPADPAAHLRSVLAGLGVEAGRTVVAVERRMPAIEAAFRDAGRAAAREPGEAEAVGFALEALAVPEPVAPELAVHRSAMAALRMRRTAAALLHAIDLLDEGPHPALRERYARRMAAATGLTWPSAPWLADADPLLSAAATLRALARARALTDPAALRAALRTTGV